MAELWDLYVEMGSVCPNFSLPCSNMDKALLAEHARDPIFSGVTCGIAAKGMANDANVYMRWGMVKYRDVARFEKVRDSVCSKVP